MLGKVGSGGGGGRREGNRDSFLSYKRSVKLAQVGEGGEEMATGTTFFHINAR